MAALTVTGVQITPTDVVRVNFSDGSQSEFASRAEVQAAGAVSSDLLKQLLLARWVGLNPAADEPGQIDGTTVEVNMASVLNPVDYGAV